MSREICSTRIFHPIDLLVYFFIPNILHFLLFSFRSKALGSVTTFSTSAYISWHLNYLLFQNWFILRHQTPPFLLNQSHLADHPSASQSWPFDPCQLAKYHLEWPVPRCTRYSLLLTSCRWHEILPLKEILSVNIMQTINKSWCCQM